MSKPKGLILLKGLLNSASDAIVAVNGNLEIVLFNKQAERIFDYAKEEVLGKSALTLMPKRFHKPVIIFAQRYYSKEHNALIATNRTFLGLRKNNEEFTINYSLSEFSTGNTNLVVCSFRDVTETIKAKVLLKESEAKYRQIVEGSHELIQSIDVDGKILFTNTAWKRTLGYTDEEVAHLTLSDVISKESKKACSLGFAKVMQGQTLQNIELTFLAKDGSKVYVKGASTPQYEGKKIVSTLGFFRDVTDKKITDKALKETKANLLALLQSSTIGYLMLDAQKRVITYNNIMQKWVTDETGQQLQEGIVYTDMLTGKRKKRASEAFEKVLKGESIEYEADGNNDNEQKYWFYISITPMLHDNGKIIGLSITCLDITEKKKAELEVKRTSDDIIQRNKDLEQFAYIVSHNLRAPLSNIMGAATILQNKTLNEEDKEQLREGIYSSVKKLDEVVIDLNNILQARQSISENKQHVTLSALILDIKHSISNLIVTEQVEIVTDFSEIDTLFTLKSYIYSIFYNLISNSIKYRKPNVAPMIKIKSRSLENGVELIFIDNGLGIDLKRYKDKIFGLYKRFHENAEGKGLGLFMVKTQVETLGGTINIESEVGKGTKFIVFFDKESITQSSE